MSHKPERASIFAVDVQVEYVATLHSLNHADGQIDERILVANEETEVGERHHSLGGAAQVEHALAGEGRVRHLQALVIGGHGFLGVEVTSQDVLQTRLINLASLQRKGQIYNYIQPDQPAKKGTDL